MNLELTDKVVIITGSGQGLGKGIAEAFLNENAMVTITDILPEKLVDVENEFINKFSNKKIHTFCGDLTKQEDIDKCIESVILKFGKIDILIANLGSGRGITDWNIPEHDWEKMIDLNFSGARRIATSIIPSMINNAGGSIIMISSIAGIENIGAPIHYSVSKAAVIAFSKSMSHKIATNNIRINTICPGNIFFENGTWDIKIKEDKTKVLNMLENTVPLNRFATPQEIANLVLFVSSKKAAFMTGSCIIMDGGQTISF